MTDIRTLPAATTGRYLVEPASEPSASGAPLLVGFHGYGQNAEMLLDELMRIPGADAWTLVSVQALHRFYNTRTQEVVGSWMTRLDRDQALADNQAYVARVVADLRAELGPGPLVFAGFSQGGAMAWRAAAAFPCDGLLVLGSDLPKEVIGDSPDSSPALPPRLLIGRGDQDTFYTAHQLAKDLAALEARGIHPGISSFHGGHEWSPIFREAAGRLLEGVRG